MSRSVMDLIRGGKRQVDALAALDGALPLKVADARGEQHHLRNRQLGGSWRFRCFALLLLAFGGEQGNQINDGDGRGDGGQGAEQIPASQHGWTPSERSRKGNRLAAMTPELGEASQAFSMGMILSDCGDRGGRTAKQKTTDRSQPQVQGISLLAAC
jgi:hypothetical protein